MLAVSGVPSCSVGRVTVVVVDAGAVVTVVTSVEESPPDDDPPIPVEVQGVTEVLAYGTAVQVEPANR